MSIINVCMIDRSDVTMICNNMMLNFGL
uniref:Uncharacterized protein n=1 Tax=Anguilla anguilla TaxID=7936 RepID=A0A0E9TUY0_ANGAN